MEAESNTGSANSRGRSQGRRRRVWPWVLGGILLLFFLIIATVVLVLVASPGGGSAGGGGGGVEWQEEYVQGEGSEKIAVLPVAGVISDQAGGGGLLGGGGGATPDALRSQLDQAADDGNVRAVILEVNSPGGAVVASDQMHQLILDFKEESDKPVVVSMEDTAASGGYYIATAADRIVANSATITGSIGVILSFLNFSEAADKYGVKQVSVTSGEFKDIGSQFEDLTPEERDILDSVVQDSYSQFVDVIVEGRDLPEDRVREISDGRIYSGLQAEELGLVDETGNLSQAVDTTENLADVSDARVVRYTQSPGLFGSLQARLAPQEPEALRTLKAAGLSPGPELQYIYRPGSLKSRLTAPATGELLVVGLALKDCEHRPLWIVQSRGPSGAHLHLPGQRLKPELFQAVS